MIFKKIRVLKWQILSLIYKKDHYRYKIYMYNHQNKNFILKKYSHLINKKFSSFGMKKYPRREEIGGIIVFLNTCIFPGLKHIT